MRALRWLKKNQMDDGSWPKCKPAMTALAILSFLAHGETPASVEFGPTVEKAIRFLVDGQDSDGHFAGRDGHDYTHPIATYALCEAYGLTKVPMIKYAAEKAIDVVIDGQNPSGGFNYNLKPSERDDTSYMGWCAQALKAAKMSGLANDGIDQCMTMAVAGFRKNGSGGSSNAGFGYTGPGMAGLTSVGTLCMQLLGKAKDPLVLGGIANLSGSTYNWEGGGKHNQLYFWYYTTQAMFHTGGKTWESWNALFKPVLIDNQTIIEDGIMGPKGEMVDIGFWEVAKEVSGHTDGDVMNTCLCALQLMVYYRYLPTFQEVTHVEDSVAEAAADDDDVDIDIGDL